MKLFLKFVGKCLIRTTVPLLIITVQGCKQETSDDAIRNGQSALRAGNYQIASKHLKRAAALNPESATAYYNLGMSQLLSNQLPEAAKSFEKSIKLNKESNTDAIEGLAETRRKQGKYEDAITQFTSATLIFGRQPHLLAGNAACQIALGHYEMAHALLDEALTTDAADPTTNYNMATLMRKPHFNDTAKSAEYYVRFLFSVKQDAFLREQELAVQAIKEIGQSRSDELTIQIDELIMQSMAARSRNIALPAAIKAVTLDFSNADALWNLINIHKKFPAENGNHAKAALDRFKRIFPYDPRAK